MNFFSRKKGAEEQRPVPQKSVQLPAPTLPRSAGPPTRPVPPGAPLPRPPLQPPNIPPSPASQAPDDLIPQTAGFTAPPPQFRAQRTSSADLDGVADWRGVKLQPLTEAVKRLALSDAPASAPRPRSMSGPEIEVLGSEDRLVSVLISFDGDVLSMPGGVFPISPEATSLCAVLDNGSFVVSKTDPINPKVEEVRAKLAKSPSVAYDVEYRVDISVIRQIYERAGNRGNRRDRESKRLNESGPVQMQVPQKQFLDLIKKAAAAGWSDVDIMVNEHETLIYATDDGEQVEQGSLTAKQGETWLQAIFNMGEDIGAGYKPLHPQDGRIAGTQYELPPEIESIRLQFNPLANMGRELSARLFYRQSQTDDRSDVDGLGYLQSQASLLKTMRKHTSGIIFFLGPTGSGKSTTMRASANAFHRETKFTKKLVCVEDPVEVRMPRATQFSMAGVKNENERVEAFRATMNAVLRSHPDNLIIGEIRDKPGMDIALLAAKSGHAVSTSMHANNNDAAFSRMEYYEVSPLDLFDHTLMRGFISQRLVRKLCPHCKIKANDAAVPRSQAIRLRQMVGHDMSILQKIYFANPKGCQLCKGGRKGREVVAEVLMPDEEYMKLLSSGPSGRFDAKAYWKRNGGITLEEHGLIKMIQGVIDCGAFEHTIGLMPPMSADRVHELFQFVVEQPVRDDFVNVFQL